MTDTSIELPTRLTLTITQEDWEAGLRWEADSCAFALAASRVIPKDTRALVPGRAISLFDNRTGRARLASYRLPDDAIELRRAFDDGTAPSLELPATFTLERVR
jgi:hypothetical protein